MSPPPRVLVLNGSRDQVATASTDVIIAEDSSRLSELRRARGRACAVGGLPVLLLGDYATTSDTTASFGSLAIVPTTPANLDDQTRSLTFLYREQVRAATEHLWQISMGLLFAIVALVALVLFLSNASLSERPDDRLQEAKAYDDYRRRFSWQQLGPEECRSEVEFQELDAALASSLAPPQKYASHWHDTPAVTLHRKWQQDTAISRELRTAMAAWYREQARRASLLLDAPRYDAAWAASVVSLMQQPSPWPQQGPVLQSQKLPQRRGMALSYDSIRASDLVQQAEREWNATAWRLTGMPAFQEFLTPLAKQAGVWPRWP